MKIGIVLFFIFATLSSCSGGGSSGTTNSSTTPPINQISDIQIRITTPVAATVFNTFLLGSNLLWPFNGEGLLLPNSIIFNSKYIDNIKKLSPTSLRFPGGDHSDYYFWKDGMGPLTGRSSNPWPPFGKINFGTKEFLELCKQLDAQPLITVNLITKDEYYARDWVKKINIDRIKSDAGNNLGKVIYWEIGNEPYLDKSDPALNISNSEFISRANNFIFQMKQIDPSIKVGIPLRLNQYNSHWALEPSKHLDFADQVLAGVNQEIDWISIHSDYRPFIVTEENNDILYNATMGSAHSVIIDLQKILTKIDTYYPDKKLPVWLTEYNSLYSLDGKNSDKYINSQASAIHIADLIIELEKQPRVEQAHYFSISDNWKFGIIQVGGETLMPSFYALMLFKNLQGFQLEDTQISGETMQINSFNYVYAATLPVVNALALKKNNQLELILVNKSKMDKIVELTFEENIVLSTFDQTSYSANTPFPLNEFSIPIKSQSSGSVLQNTAMITLPKLSFSKIHIK